MRREELKEKKELIYNFGVLEREYDIPIRYTKKKFGTDVFYSKKYTVDDDLDEMRFEYYKIRSEEDVRVRVNKAWGTFMMINNILVLLNDAVDPFDMKMEGWPGELDKQKLEYEPHIRRLCKNNTFKVQDRFFCITFSSHQNQE